ncbi:MAG: transcription elongation factor GreA [Thermoleophilaceae bacterium]|nr:transcription elongation factor GreA [Thermoleophilaceae bacterium]
MPKETLLTQAGYDKLKAEIDDLCIRGRREIADRIRVAREFGDISENAEYDAAKNEQAMLEGRIAQLEEKMRSASVVDKSKIDGETVSVGTTVHLKDQKTAKSVKYEIVGSTEADPINGKLSNESPIGKALQGHKRNDIVKIPVPRGPARQLKITKIEA